MKDKQVGNNIDDYQVMITRSLERIKGMRNLIFDLLDLTRIESGKKQRNFSNVNLIEVANIAIGTVEPMAIQKNIKINKKFHGDIIFEADANEIEIVFNNLLSNAVKYNIENGNVTFSIFKEANSIKIIVEDTGIGMTEVEIQSLFKDFMRIKNEKTKYISGSGLGLSITKKIINLYNGDIQTESIPNKGTKFTLSLPVKAN